jgi:glutamate racemase
MIGVFDSGIGGLTVLSALEKALPQMSFVYVGDTARTPYGIKSATVIQKYTYELIKWLINNNKGIDTVVLACNTASATSKDYLAQKLPHLRIIDVITPAVSLALRSTNNGRIGVIGTTATIKSDIYKKLLEKSDKVKEIISISCPLLVPIVEEGLWNQEIAKLALNLYLEPIIKKRVNIDTLILGCTHYPLLLPILKKLLKGIKLISSANAVANYLKALAKKEGWLNNLKEKKGKSIFYVTDSPETFSSTGSKILKRKIKAKLLPLQDT